MDNVQAVWWTVPQACVWIATRDGALVAAVEPQDMLGSLDDDLAIGDETYGTVWQARLQLAAACAAGRLALVGAARGEGDAVDIPVSAWANLEIQDSTADGPIAASAKFPNVAATWWTDIKVRRTDVEREWPSAAQTADSGESTLNYDQTLDLDEVTKWLVAEMARRGREDAERGRDAMEVAMCTKFPGLGSRQARQLYKDVPKALKPRRGRRPKSGKSGQI